MKKTSIQKLCLAALLCAVAVVGSLFSFPVFGSKCAPVQHMVNILCAVLLGPWYGVAVAFCASEVAGTSLLGGLCAYPVAILLMNQSAAEVAFYAYIVPFFVSTAGGAVISGVLLYALQRASVLRKMQLQLSR